MKKYFALLFLFIAVHCSAQTKMGFNMLKLDTAIFKATTKAGDPNFIRVDSNWVKLFLSGSGGGGAWGGITGTLSNQTDLQNALNAKQPLNAHLTTISGLTPTNDDVLQYKSGAWVNRTIAQLKSDLNITAGGESFSQTLAIGNTTGGNNILVDAPDLIQNTGGTNTIDMNASGIGTSISSLIFFDLDVASGSQTLEMDGTFVELKDVSGSRLYYNGSGATRIEGNTISLAGATTNVSGLSGSGTRMVTANAAGDLSTRAIGVDTIYRTAGKDSIQYTINGIYHAIKDSIGSSSGFVPTSRTLTINGTTFDLSANRTWTLSFESPITASNTVKQYWNGFKNFVTLNTDSINEGATNLFYTNARSRGSVSLTTTGTSGAATYNSSTGVLNVPNYANSGGTVTNFSFTDGNGIVGNVTNPTTTPALGLTLTDITPSTVITNTLTTSADVTVGGDLIVAGNVGATNFSGTSSGTNTGDQDLSSYLRLSGGTMIGDILLASATPTNALNPAPKSYVDNLITGITWKNAVKCASTVNLALSGTSNVDGVTIPAGTRVLAKNQTTTSTNGIYASAAGAWTRVTDADDATELETATVLVTNGTVNKNTQWTETLAITTVGTDPINFSQIAGAGTYTNGAGIDLSGNVFSVASLGIINSMVNDVAFSKLTSTPTTLAGYGIGDAYTKTASDARYFQISNNLSEGTAATMRTNLGLGTLATQSGTFSGTSSGTNTGDQTSVTGNAGTATALATARTIGTVTGDATSSGSSFDGTANNTNALTLATVNSNVGSFGSATTSLTATVNGKGLITAISSQTVTPAVGSITGFGTGVGTALAVNVGSSGAFVTNGGALGTPSSGVATNLTGLPLGGMANLSALSVIGNNTGSSATPVAVSMASLDTLLGNKVVVQAADLATTSTTMVNVNADSMYVAANTTYILTISGRIGSSGTNGGKVTIITPSGCTIQFISFGNSSTGNLFTGNGVIQTSGDESNTFNNGAFSVGMFFMQGSIIVGGTAGYVKLQARAVTSGTFSVFAGTRLVLQRVN